MQAGLERRAAEADLADLAGVADLVVTDTDLRCTVETAHLGALLERLGEHGIRTLTSAPPTLEELFLEQYRTTEVAGPR